MSKELQISLSQIESINSLAELSIVMEAVVIRLRELTPMEDHLESAIDDGQLAKKLMDRLEAFENGDSPTISRQVFMERVRAKMNPK